MAHDVFISYSHKDKAVADAICASLEQDGCRCWYAPRDIEPGAVWAASIIEAIQSTKVMVMIFTDFSNASNQVLREISTAVSCGVTLIPFRLTTNEPSDAMRYYLATVHWLDAMDEPLDNGIRQLSQRVRPLLNLDAEPAEAPHTPPAPPAPPAPAPAHAWKKWIVIAAGLLLAGAVVFFSLHGKGQPASQEATAVPIAETSAPLEETTPEPTPATTTEPTPMPAPTAEPAPTPAPEAEIDNTQSADAGNYLYSAGGQTVTIQKYIGDQYTVVTIPETIDGLPVTKIEDKCFQDHTEIQQVVLPESLSILGERVFYGCTALTEINFPDNLREISGWTFAHTGLTKVTLPDTVKKLGYGSFYSCVKLESVFLPETVTKIGEDTFRMCPRLKSVTITAENPDINIKAFNENAKVTIIGVPGSYSEKYAQALNLKFEAYTD